jgi:hypothetical protein
MLAAVSEEMVDELAVAGTPEQVNARLRRFDGLADEIVLFPPGFRVSPERKAENADSVNGPLAPLDPSRGRAVTCRQLTKRSVETEEE